MKRHDDSERSGRLAVTQPVHPTPPPPPTFRTDEQLTAPADRRVRDPAHTTVAFTTAVAIRGTDSVHRRTGMRTARAVIVDRNRPGSPPATDCRQDPPPASPVNHIRGCAHYHPDQDLFSVNCRNLHNMEWRCKMILKEPHARAA